MPFIRKLGPTDLNRLKNHFARLDHDDRYLRFGHQISDSAMNDYLERIDWGRAIVLGYLDNGALRGAVEIVPFGRDAPEGAELALTVEKPWRGTGVGYELCRNALILACNRYIRDVTMMCLAENVPMQRIARKLRGRVTRMDSEVESRVVLPRPTPWSIMQEALVAGAAVVGEVADQWTIRGASNEPAAPAEGDRSAA
jgi:GNAT superfamily N-acetyltransferase